MDVILVQIDNNH